MTPPPSSPQRLSAGFVLMLSALVAIGPLTIDLYLAAFPEITTDLATTESRVQLTMTATLAGLATGQLLLGAVADAIGRRRPLLVALAVYVLVSAAITMVQSVELLMVLRAVQGLTGAAGMVLSMATVRDNFSGPRVGKVLARLMLVVGVAPILAPTIGSQILLFGTWRTMFWALAGFGALLFAIAYFRFTESLPARYRRTGGVRPALRTYGSLLTDSSVIPVTLMGAFFLGAMFTYVSSSPFVFQENFGLSPSQFGLIFGAGAVAVTIGTQVNGFLMGRITPQRIVSIAVLVGWSLSVALLVVAVTVGDTDAGLWPLLAILIPTLGTVGFVMPSVPTIILEHNAHRAGSTAALNGAVNFSMGAVVAPVSGLLGGQSAWSMAVVMCSVMTVGVALLAFNARRWRREQAFSGVVPGARDLAGNAVSSPSVGG